VNRRKRSHRPSRVGQIEVRVGVPRQAGVAAPHELLGDTGRDAIACQQRGKGMPQAVHVHRLALGSDPRSRQVEVERPEQVPPVDAEQRRIRRDLPAVGLGQSIDMLAQVVGQVTPQRKCRSPAALGMLALDAVPKVHRFG